MESKALNAALAAKDTATDGAYILAQDANGNTIRIAKADLASVLAGIWAVPYSSAGYSGDLNDLKDFGFYGIAIETTNKPFTYCCVLVFPYYTTGDFCCAQIAIERNVKAGSAPSLAVRCFRDSETYGWCDWKVL